MNAVPVRITQGGRLVIPAVYRKSMKLQDGAVVLLQMHGNVLQVRTMDETLDAIQARYAPLGEGSIVDEFIEERRREAAKELED